MSSQLIHSRIIVCFSFSIKESSAHFYKIWFLKINDFLKIFKIFNSTITVNVLKTTDAVFKKVLTIYTILVNILLSSGSPLTKYFSQNPLIYTHANFSLYI